MKDWEPQDATVTDPVCGMEVDLATGKHTSEHDGVTYAFCSLMCKRAFDDDPQHYLQQRVPGRTSPRSARPHPSRPKDER